MSNSVKVVHFYNIIYTCLMGDLIHATLLMAVSILKSRSDTSLIPIKEVTPAIHSVRKGILKSPHPLIPYEK